MTGRINQVARVHRDAGRGDRATARTPRSTVSKRESLSLRVLVSFVFDYSLSASSRGEAGPRVAMRLSMRPKHQAPSLSERARTAARPSRRRSVPSATLRLLAPAERHAPAVAAATTGRARTDKRRRDATHEIRFTEPFGKLKRTAASYWFPERRTDDAFAPPAARCK